ncbi:DUF4065 domain-containing protein [Brevundimonas basaltis]|uniref:Putative phage-associated protein n=1 Tax=Brevundimonas basaltis TaxID=472166 RepID=A0A7W8HXH7_9CAUL|nr:type II toxin-antitoxin system antitoxin SocA domain-containing protein [Brevundimonas basaltis]MBB5291726.1 putative phage-associated protein [Brevundimonas basaltis]
MPSARDVAQHILERRGGMTAMKLQKLVYYSQAWSIVWDDNVVFPEPIEAWRNGPVVRDLWESTRGQFRVDRVPGGTAGNLSAAQQETVDRVLAAYGDKDAQWLSDLTHMEAPWQEAFARGQSSPISLEIMSEFYSSLGPNEQAAGAA